MGQTAALGAHARGGTVVTRKHHQGHTPPARPPLTPSAKCPRAKVVRAFAPTCQQGIFTKQLTAPVLPRGQEARGVLGALGQVISWGYTEAFDPGGVGAVACMLTGMVKPGA